MKSRSCREKITGRIVLAETRGFGKRGTYCGLGDRFSVAGRGERGLGKLYMSG